MSRGAPAIAWELACMMMRDLSGYKGYPKPIDSPGEHHFIRAFQEAVISVEHAQAVIDSFDQEFPTVLHLRESAHKLRGRFENQSLKAKEWEKQYGPRQPFDADFKIGREIDRLGAQVMSFLRTTNYDGQGDVQKVHWGRWWQIAKHLGYKMNRHQLNEIEDYERAFPQPRQNLPVKPTPITEHDVKRLAAGEQKDRWD